MAGVRITMNGLALRASEGPVFGPVHATVEPGQYAQVVSATGTGRSSLLLAMAGRMRGCTGSGTVGGLPLTDRRVRRLVRIARIGGAVEADDHLRVRRLLESAGPVRTVGAALRVTGLDVDPGARVRDLAAVDQLLLAVACCVATGAPGIVVDEADIGLLPEQAERVRSALRAVVDSGPTVVASAVVVDPWADVLIATRPATGDRSEADA
ncbi:MAG: hypothetical protein HOV79_09100 [Hamadaea sp.]|nr:hypothetical protein [Hamadaea sp.]